MAVQMEGEELNREQGYLKSAPPILAPCLSKTAHLATVFFNGTTGNPYFCFTKMVRGEGRTAESF